MNTALLHLQHAHTAVPQTGTSSPWGVCNGGKITLYSNSPENREGGVTARQYSITSNNLGISRAAIGDDFGRGIILGIISDGG